MARLILSSLFLLIPGVLNATPYFRLIDVRHPQVVAGVWADPIGAGKPSFGSAVALVTHSTRDGSLFKSLQADWSPLAVGGGYGDGTAFGAMGPSANLLPAVKSLALAGLDAADKKGKYANLRSLLAPPPGGGPDITISAGPQFLTRPLENGVILPFNKWKGYHRWFFGAAWQF